jgi:chromosome segregation ATPase
MTLIIIILIICVVIYFYYQRPKLTFNSGGSSPDFTDNQTELNQTNQTLTAFLRSNLNSNSLEELKTKLGEKSLDELIEENEDYETEIDNLTRTKNSLEADLLAQSNAFQSRIREKDREIKKAKEDLTAEKKRTENTQSKLTSEKQQHKGSLERIKLLTEQITKLEKDQQETKQQHTEQLRMINLLFDTNAKDYKEIDFNGLYELLRKISQKDLPGSFPQENKDD